MTSVLVSTGLNVILNLKHKTVLTIGTMDAGQNVTAKILPWQRRFSAVIKVFLKPLIPLLQVHICIVLYSDYLYM